MTDQSVKMGLEEVVRLERKELAARIMLRRLVRQRCAPEAISKVVERFVVKGLAQGESLDGMIQWFLVIRSSLRQESATVDFPISELIDAFHRLARDRGISSDEFYPALLERVISEGEAEEAAKLLAKLSTRDKILDAALDVFAERGFHLSTVDEIAERAGVGKGTLYRYFANKETLFNELVRIRLEELEKRVQDVLDGHDDVLTMIEKYLRAYFEFFDVNRRLYRLIIRERLDVGERFQDLYIQKVMRRIPMLKRKIFQASQQKILKDVDFQTVFYGVMGFLHGVMQKWLASDCDYSLLEELPTVTEVLFHGFVKSAAIANEE